MARPYPDLSFVGTPHSFLFELQAEAVFAQWNIDNNDENVDRNGEDRHHDSYKLPTLKERTESAARDAIRGGAKKTGNVTDTHYLGDQHWPYCRTMAKMAGSHDETLENYLVTTEKIEDHSRDGNEPQDIRGVPIHIDRYVIDDWTTNNPFKYHHRSYKRKRFVRFFFKKKNDHG